MGSPVNSFRFSKKKKKKGCFRKSDEGTSIKNIDVYPELSQNRQGLQQQYREKQAELIVIFTEMSVMRNV